MSKIHYPKMIGYRDVTDPHNAKDDVSCEGSYHSRDKMNYCTECKRVWEHVCSIGNRPARVEYYPIVPSLGKPRVICAECEKLKNGF